MLDEILNIATAAGLQFSESFYNMVLKRLESFGYFPEPDDVWMIVFASQKTEAHIRNECNIVEIPDGLIPIAVDMVCGEFLQGKMQSGKLVLTDIDLDVAIASIKEGDTQVNFKPEDSGSEKFNRLLNYLKHFEDGDLICYRKIKW